MFICDYLKKQIATIAIVAFSVCVSSCSSSSSDIDEPVGESLVTLKIVLPQDEVSDMDSQMSRNGSTVPSDDLEESRIFSLKFFIFDTDNSNVLEQYKSVAIDSNGESTDPMWDKDNRTLRITVTQGNKWINCLANWTDVASDGMPAVGDGVVLSNLMNLTRVHTNLVLSNPPVMAGYQSESIVGNEPFLSIKLARQIGRVELAFLLSDVLNANPSPEIKITGVKFLNLPSTSYVFSKVASPSGLSLWSQGTFSGATSGALTATAANYATRYYIPEYYPSGESTATTMVIRALYNGVPTYYSLVLNPASSPNNTIYNHPAYAIERNHTYQYTITIEGIGESTAPTRSADSVSAGITYKLEIK